ncbi:MAG: radical SAM protein [Defluviitaleaceae bacterium]|nr:radical SAM protein [Defluviitaleaceae bacterium]
MELIEAKNIVRTNRTLNYNYIAAEYTMNIYHGCSHGCIYCYARGEYWKIPDFDRERAKKDALRIIRDDLRRKAKRGIVGIGGVSDTYNSQEAEHKLTRNALELINAFSFGASILTKSDLVLRDMDILSDIREHAPVCVCFSITCAADALCRLVEPYTAPSSKRFAAIRELSKHGILTGVMLDPVLPFITDTEDNIRGIVRQAKEAGASFIYASLSTTLEGIQRDYFYKQLDTHFPGMTERYRKRFDVRYRCPSPKARKLWAIFEDECHKQGIVYDMKVANRMIRDGYDLGSL